MKLILSVDEINFTIQSHQVHEDCRGQIGCLMTMGKGAAISSSNLMKCNTRSSTETELISLQDKLPDFIWMRHFECQGYDINEYIIFQDNMSSPSLEKNGRVSSSGQTKHVKAKYLLDIDSWLLLFSFTLKLVGKIMSSLGVFYRTPGCSLLVLLLVEVSLPLGGKSYLPMYLLV